MSGRDAQPRFARSGPMDAERGELGLGFQIVIECLMRAAALAAATKVADADSGLGVDGKADGAGVSIGTGVDFMDGFKDGIGLAGDFPEGPQTRP